MIGFAICSASSESGDRDSLFVAPTKQKKMALNALFRRAALAVPRAAPSLLRSARTPVARRFASPAAPATSHSSGGAYDGFDIHPPAKALVVEAKLWGALAWFWIFYQLHNNWDVMLVRACV